MKILVSACLLGIPCRYDGKEALHEGVCSLAKSHSLVPVCPEQLGGLPTPRQPAEMRHDRVVTRTGENVTEAFAKGAELATLLAKRLGCTHAILKQNSPSCGCGRVYDGTFSGRKIVGDGIAAARLKADGIIVHSEDFWEEAQRNENDQT